MSFFSRHCQVTRRHFITFPAHLITSLAHFITLPPHLITSLAHFIISRCDFSGGFMNFQIVFLSLSGNSRGRIL
jgi:hypothetical protein